MDYIAYLHKERKSNFGVSFPDFPGCVTAGKTLEETRRMAAEALSFHIEGMVEDGEDIPEPSTLDDLANDPAVKDAVAFLVHIEPATGKTLRINITAREHQVEEIDQRAKRAGMTRSAYMVHSSLAGEPKTSGFMTEKPRTAKRKTEGRAQHSARTRNLEG